MRVDGGKAIVPNVIKAVEIARQHGILVVWVISIAIFHFIPTPSFHILIALFVSYENLTTNQKFKIWLKRGIEF